MLPSSDSFNNRSLDLAFIDPVQALVLAQKAMELSENYEKGRAYVFRNLAGI